MTQISDILQQTLEDEFTVPPGDRFQVFEALPSTSACLTATIKAAGAAIISFSFIFWRANRTPEQKQNLCRVLCQRLQSALDIHPNDVMVMIQFNTADEWSFSQGRLLSEEA
jgi:phenylpyruvate tautomerase PptA (4-oxalocrotonate tautomerase family)